ncbi:hypothetical protein AAJ76_1500040090 [Vairimorpha ceranae]|uniref:Uncharacterized protein n=1 Tax=Vairimorpha ceranae TaxID=40302 RepID=A0A0F9ZDQ2_9MICR|nr:hypothetical protein AAJ76_1500040090 [Vairimorpha ceranae]KAF5140441.1 hypothetical protein G9O61_00g012460 [Vairimorpha ceranae]KKO75659.1 hypothetical protein AAJ76_1500040090 [Vairimorpha ceranae]
MEELYSNDITEIKTEITVTEDKKNIDFFIVKLELLQIYLLCYTLYKENYNEDILEKLIRITNLLKKCKIIEEHIDILNTIKEEEPERRILENVMKKKSKKSKGNNPRKKFKNRNEQMADKCNKKYDGKIN